MEMISSFELTLSRKWLNKWFGREDFSKTMNCVTWRLSAACRALLSSRSDRSKHPDPTGRWASCWSESRRRLRAPSRKIRAPEGGASATSKVYDLHARSTQLCGWRFKLPICSCGCVFRNRKWHAIPSDNAQTSQNLLLIFFNDLIRFY